MGQGRVGEQGGQDELLKMMCVERLIYLREANVFALAEHVALFYCCKN